MTKEDFYDAIKAGVEDALDSKKVDGLSPENPDDRQVGPEGETTAKLNSTMESFNGMIGDLNNVKGKFYTLLYSLVPHMATGGTVQSLPLTIPWPGGSKSLNIELDKISGATAIWWLFAFIISFFTIQACVRMIRGAFV
jgi:hypothetical protein